MGSDKRQRQRENRMKAIAEAERAKKRSTSTRKIVLIVLAVAAVLVGLLLWSWLSPDGDDEMTEGEADTETVATETLEPEPADDSDGTDGSDGATDDDADSDSELQTPSDHPADQAQETDETDTAESGDPAASGDCPPTDGSGEVRTQLAAAPPLCIDPSTLYAATFDTSMGSFTMVLDPALDELSVNNFIVLARWQAYDGTLFHRIIQDFVIQGGDVQLMGGVGGPGYSFTGGFPEEGWYRLGSVAMANRGDPSSNGAQFFVITGPNGAALPPLYSPLGQVTDGMDVVLAIEGVATGDADAPLEPVTVNSVRIAEATDAQIAAYAEARS